MMSGLPFGVFNSPEFRSGIVHSAINSKNTATDILGASFLPGTSTMEFIKLNANNTKWNVTDMTANMTFYFHGRFLRAVS